MNFEADIRSEVLKLLPHDRNDSAAVSELATKPVPDLLIRYYNWVSRLVRPTPRSLHLSREFSTNPLRTTHSTAISNIFSDIQAGRDITPRLSKGIQKGYVTGSRAESADKDLMLNDWGIHHLHLGIVADTKDPAFVARTRDLLFAIFKPTAAYVINIFAHKTWTDRDIVRTVIGNWPNLDFFIELSGVGAPVGTGYTEAEHQTLRKAGVLVTVDIDGRTFVGRSFLSTAGISGDANSAAKDLMRRVRDFEERAANKPDELRRNLAKAGVKLPPNPDFQFVFLNEGYGVQERTTGVVLVLSGESS